MKKKLCALALCVIMVVALAVPALAAPNDVVTNCVYADTSHPFAFFTARDITSKLINQYTTGRPVPGTPLTTWSWTGDTSQWFEAALFTANGSVGSAWCVWGNPNLVINCKRVGATPEVNVDTALQNYRADIEINFPNAGSGKLGIAPRYIHSSNMYITVGAPMSGGNYLNWTPRGTVFYQYDVGIGEFY